THAGSIVISLAAGAPANNTCANATAVGEGSFPYSTCGATTDGPSPCGLKGKDIWYRYTASVTGMATATTCAPSRSYDTVIAVSNTPCGGGAAIGCNDDGPPFCANTGVPFSG